MKLYRLYYNKAPLYVARFVVPGSLMFKEMFLCIIHFFRCLHRVWTSSLMWRWLFWRYCTSLCLYFLVWNSSEQSGKFTWRRWFIWRKTNGTINKIGEKSWKCMWLCSEIRNRSLWVKSLLKSLSYLWIIAKLNSLLINQNNKKLSYS